MKNKSRLVIGWATIAWSVACGSSIAQETSDVLYKAGTIYTMTGDPITDGQVLVSNGKIVDVGQSVEVNENTSVVDLGSQTVLIPGLIDAYSQVGIYGGENEMTSELTPEFSVDRVIDWDHEAYRRSLDSGITSINVCPGTANVVAGTSTLIKTPSDGREVVIDDGVVVTNVCTDPASGNRARQRPDGLYVRQPTNRMGVVWILRNELDQVRRNEVGQNSKLTDVMSGERRVFAISRTMVDLNALMTISSEFGISPVAVGGHEAYKVADQLAAANIPVILGRLTTGSITGPEQSELCWNQAQVLGDAGVTIAISGGNLLEQARFAHRFGLGSNQALRAVTRNPAEILGIEQRIGSIASGMDADMVALDGDPLQATTPIRWVMVNGNIVVNQKGK